MKAEIPIPAEGLRSRAWRRRTGAGFCWILLVLGLVSMANAQKATLFTGWPVSDTGYLHIKVRVSESPPRPAPRDRQYWVVVTQSDWQREHSVVRRPFVLEAGQIETEVEVRVPVQNWSYNRRMTVFVNTSGATSPDRRDLIREPLDLTNVGEVDRRNVLWVTRDLAEEGRLERTINRGGRPTEKRYPLALKNSQRAPSLGVIANWYSDVQGQVQAVQGLDTSAALNMKSGLHAVQPENVPRDWSGLSALEFVLISIGDLQYLQQSVPESFVALTHWVAAGGRLVVTGCGPDFERADSVRSALPGANNARFQETGSWRYLGSTLWSRNRSLQMVAGTSGFANSSVAPSRSANQGWRGGDVSNWALTDDERLLAVLPEDVQPGKTDFSALGQIELRDPAAVLVCGYLDGEIFCVKDNMNQWKQDDWIRLFNASTAAGPPPYVNWPSLESELDADFSIPGVGQPPVRAFLLLLGVFLLAVGPITYVVLRRRQRLQWMFLVVPVISFGCCISLLAWAMLSEGFQLRARARAFTDIDHVTNQAVTQERYSLYAGLQPGAYRFAAADYVAECWPTRQVRYLYGQDQLEYSGGNARPRMPHQLVSVRRHEAEGGLFPAARAGGGVEVENRFPFDVAAGLVRVEGGYYLVRNLAAGESATAEPVAEGSGSKVFRDLCRELSPANLDEFARSGYLSGYRYGYRVDSEMPLNGHVDRLADGLASGKDPRALLVQDNSYLAILGQLTGPAPPAEGIEFAYQLQIVRGQW